MKIKLIISAMLLFSFGLVKAQENSVSRIPLIGESAPVFTAESTNGQITFPDDFGSKWKILFSHPADFTPVCSSEILELAQMQSKFDKLGVKIAVLSTDVLTKHYEWKKSLETLSYKNREPVKIDFPLIADDNWYASKEYGMLHSPTSNEKDVRGVFIIDPMNKVRAIYFYPMEIGRNMDEIQRTVVALQTADKEKVNTPANWQPGDDVLVRYVKSANDPVNDDTGNGMGIYKVSWYMMFKKLDMPTASK
jgi:peroxiredoxin 2/4